MDCFYVLPENIEGDSIVVESDEHKHLTRVLRKGVGDHILVVDGVGNSYEAEIKDIGATATHCLILKSSYRHREPSVSVTLAQAILKSPARFDWVVEKTTELGICQIIPMVTARVIAKNPRTDRWRKVAIAAMKQSCRSVLPEVFAPTTFADVLSHSKQYVLKLVLYEHAGDSSFITSIVGSDRAADAIFLMVGPEGGFTEDELRRATMDHQFVPVSLGRRRLRSETAGLLSTAYAVGNR
jgi:16S rRNA (uracil1498-N3)-methyltransferase